MVRNDISLTIDRAFRMQECMRKAGISRANVERITGPDGIELWKQFRKLLPESASS